MLCSLHRLSMKRSAIQNITNTLVSLVSRLLAEAARKIIKLGSCPRLIKSCQYLQVETSASLGAVAANRIAILGTNDCR